MFPRLIPRETKFFDLFDQSASCVRRAADRLTQLVMEHDRLTERANELRDEADGCQDVVARTIGEIDRSFITPLDREDMYRLVSALGDITQQIKRAGYCLESFDRKETIPDSATMTTVVRDCCKNIADAAGLLRDLSNAETIFANLREIERLAREADELDRFVNKALFANPLEPLSLMRGRELHESLRMIVDCCRRAGKVVCEIVLKGN